MSDQFNYDPNQKKDENKVMNQEQILGYMKILLGMMVTQKGSDLFITAGYPPAMKINGSMTKLNDQPLSPNQALAFVYSLMNDTQRKEFDTKFECNYAIAIEGVARFHINAFKQQKNAGMVIHIINTKIPNIDELNVPEVLKKIIMEKRGLVIVVGATGSGKSTTLAAMIGHRNSNQAGHIITIEDPIEFVHNHRKSIVTQREVGVDTFSFDEALKNTLRQAPDVILIGEIRDRATMEYAVFFAETGHLCIATLHANNSNQALNRIINFFPEERRPQLLMDLSLNLKSVVSQRLIPTQEGGRAAAVEVLMNTPYIQDLIFKGEVDTIKETMKNADSMTDLKLRIKLNSSRGLPKEDVKQVEAKPGLPKSGLQIVE